MNDQQKAFFQDLESTFDSNGWDRLSKGWEEERNQLKEAVFYNAKTEMDLAVARVRYNLLTELVRLPEVTADQKQEILEGE
jgi:hypothetical protein